MTPAGSSHRTRWDLFLPDTPAIYPAWEPVLAHGVSGKPSHAARVAATRVHGLTAILTFDKSVFSRFPAV